MASSFAEKAQVAAITATLVSAGWIMAGAVLLDREESAEIADQLEGKKTADPMNPDRERADTEAREMAGAQPEVTTVPIDQPNGLKIPVMGISATDLSDNFSDDRGGGTRLHQAIDIMADEGTSVVAAAPGEVERLFRSEAGGNTIYVRSEDRETIYYYAHLSDYAQGLNEGQQIRRGQRLGTVGSSGNADPEAPHLHFEIMRTTPLAEWWEPASSVNPYPLLVAQSR